ncbi:hypothetical protein AB4455_04755 [Vibrio sp. 10N.261.46.E12]|uniref:hypothetical protein n=1 Tax=unclassified Vibrio TaxID=2614977 RepID=UPI0009780E3D|nr:MULTISPECIES: hypothetical protein [unclassified Vibrio]PMM76777.1 hypothetical protein BCT48_24565 [Vibrio sp. 10N.261.46.F12]OMO36242.1 hypothetical protein BH584_05550 [Vibrio sp. 10N.261.45.E1]PMJ34406.1 hypothetical protein BCU27_02985 [Vibrio sp. 10N.286.45.B6]PML86777.1 hypothetical protein BCT66_00690 [Vibrio sp. 10N.261.49.E11]PMM81855.1 hypothetical protein BCT46_15730 [Vibrio sp. 10N.261.46.E8]
MKVIQRLVLFVGVILLAIHYLFVPDTLVKSYGLLGIAVGVGFWAQNKTKFIEARFNQKAHRNHEL